MPSMHTFSGASKYDQRGYRLCLFYKGGFRRPKRWNGQVEIPRFSYVVQARIGILTILALGYRLEH